MKTLNIAPGLTGCYELTTGTGKRLVLVGLGETVEIWTAEAWQAEQEKAMGADDPDLTVMEQLGIDKLLWP